MIFRVCAASSQRSLITNITLTALSYTMVKYVLNHKYLKITIAFNLTKNQPMFLTNPFNCMSCCSTLPLGKVGKLFCVWGFLHSTTFSRENNASFALLNSTMLLCLLCTCFERVV